MPYRRPILVVLALLMMVEGLVALFVVAQRNGWRPPELGRSAHAQQDCTEVLTLGPETESQTTEPFEIVENSFRVSGEVRATQGTSPRLQITPKDETGQSLSVVSSSEEGPFDQLVRQGPGTFTLDITATDTEYTVSVEDCVLPAPGDPGDEGTSPEFTVPQPTPSPPPPQPVPAPQPTPPPPPEPRPSDQDGTLMKGSMVTVRRRADLSWRQTPSMRPSTSSTGDTQP
jgi:hypothetical protein